MIKMTLGQGQSVIDDLESKRSQCYTVVQIQVKLKRLQKTEIG